MVSSPPRQHFQEIATVKNDVTYPLYGGYFSTGSRLQWKDKVLIQKGTAESYDIYQDLKRDPHIYAVLQKRYMAVVGREWRVTPGGDRRIDRKAADMVRSQLEALSTRATTEMSRQAAVSGSGGFDVTCLGLLDAILIGFSVGEIIYDRDNKEIFPREIRIKNQRRFAFFADPKNESFLIKLLTPTSPYDGEFLPVRKFIPHIFHGEYDNPYGLGLGGKLYWPAFFKKHNVKFWLAFNDKFGSPTTVGTYQPGNNEQRDALLRAIKAIAQEAGVTIPEGTNLEFLEASRGSSINSYKDLASYMDAEISKAVLGETGTTDQSTGGGSRARDEVANDIRLEIAKFDADLLSDTLNRTLVKWIIDYNFAPGTVAYPTVWRRFPEFEEKEDLDSRVGRDKSLQELGWRLTPEKVEEVYGDGYVSIAGQDEESEPPLVSTLGVGGVQALTGFLSQVTQGGLPRENAIATLTTIFGIPAETAEQMVPEQVEGTGEPQQDIQGELDGIFGVDNAPPSEGTNDQTDVDEAIEASEFEGLRCKVPSDKARDGSKCGRRAVNSSPTEEEDPFTEIENVLTNQDDPFSDSANSTSEIFQNRNLIKGNESNEKGNFLSQEIDDLEDLTPQNVADVLFKTEDPIVALEMAYPGNWKPSDLRKEQSLNQELFDFDPEDPDFPEEDFQDALWNQPMIILAQNKRLRKYLRPDSNWEKVNAIIENNRANFNEASKSIGDIASKFTEEAVEDVQGAIAQWASQIESAIDEIDALDLSDRDKFLQLQERLYALYDEMPLDDYVGVLGEAIAAAEVAGRYEVVEEIPVGELAFNEWILEFAAKSKSGKSRKCNPSRSFPCGRSCQPHKNKNGSARQCRNPLEGQAKTAQEWLKTNGQQSVAPIAKVELFKEHVISADKGINAETLDAAWDAIRSDGAGERKALVRSIINEQRIQAVFNDSKSRTRNKTETLFDGLESAAMAQARIAEREIVLRQLGRSDSEIAKETRKIKQQYVGSVSSNLNGYTRGGDRHITVLTNSKERTTDGFSVSNLDVETSIEVVEQLASQGSPAWSISSSAILPSQATFNVYLHEIGHQMHFIAQQHGTPRTPPTTARRFTRYSEVNGAEYFAEHFALWVLDGKRFEESDPIGYRYINDAIQNAQGAPRRIP